MTQISRFIGEVVPVAQRVTGDGGESATPEGGGGFADYAPDSLHEVFQPLVETFDPPVVETVIEKAKIVKYADNSFSLRRSASSTTLSMIVHEYF